MNPLKKSPKISAKIFCEKCNYKCSKQSEYSKHILTNKHKILQNPTKSYEILRNPTFIVKRLFLSKDKDKTFASHPMGLIRWL